MIFPHTGDGNASKPVNHTIQADARLGHIDVQRHRSDPHGLLEATWVRQGLRPVLDQSDFNQFCGPRTLFVFPVVVAPQRFYMLGALHATSMEYSIEALVERSEMSMLREGNCSVCAIISTTACVALPSVRHRM